MSEGLKVEKRPIPRVEPAHMVVTFHTAVHDSRIPLFADPFSRNVRIDPVWKSPHRRIYLTKLHGCAGVVLNRVLELVAKIAIVEEDVGIVEPSVEMPFDGLDRLNDSLQLFIPCQDDKCSVGPGSINLGIQAPVGEDLVILLADSSRVGLQSAPQGQVVADYQRDTYRIDGGAPAGINSLAGPEGCRTSRTRMRMMTRHGKSRTTPSGMDTLELPRRRIRRRKKANLGVRYSRCCERLLTAGSFSKEVKLRDDGNRLARFWTNPMV